MHHYLALVCPSGWPPDFSERRYATTARASAGSKRYSGMGGLAPDPSGATPELRNLIACSSVQFGSPAMPGESEVQPGIGTVGLKISSAPCSHFSSINFPCSSRGVWQSRHPPMSMARYLPRAISLAWSSGGADDTGIETMDTSTRRRASPAPGCSNRRGPRQPLCRRLPARRYGDLPR